MRIPLEVRTISLQALAAQAPEHVEGRLRKMLSSPVNRLQFSAREGTVLSSALRDYAENQLRDGSESHQLANEFANSLGDFAVTMGEARDISVRELQEAVEDERAHMDALAARAGFERMKRRRDEMLREVFTGGPRYKRDLWTGDVVIDDPHGRDDAQTPVYFDPEVKEALPPFDPLPGRVKHLQGFVGTAPVTLNRQQAADAVDALGSVVDHNTRMKIEGAEQLILDRNRGAGE